VNVDVLPTAIVGVFVIVLVGVLVKVEVTVLVRVLVIVAVFINVTVFVAVSVAVAVAVKVAVMTTVFEFAAVEVPVGLEVVGPVTERDLEQPRSIAVINKTAMDVS